MPPKPAGGMSGVAIGAIVFVIFAIIGVVIYLSWSTLFPVEMTSAPSAPLAVTDGPIVPEVTSAPVRDLSLYAETTPSARLTTDQAPVATPTPTPTPTPPPVTLPPLAKWTFKNSNGKYLCQASGQNPTTYLPYDPAICIWNTQLKDGRRQIVKNIGSGSCFGADATVSYDCREGDLDNGTKWLHLDDNSIRQAVGAPNALIAGTSLRMGVPAPVSAGVPQLTAPISDYKWTAIPTVSVPVGDLRSTPAPPPPPPPPKKSGETCTISQECLSTFCVAGKCLSNPGQPCVAHSDCKNGKCYPPEKVCLDDNRIAGSDCVDMSIFPGLSSGAQCLSGVCSGGHCTSSATATVAAGTFIDGSSVTFKYTEASGTEYYLRPCVDLNSANPNCVSKTVSFAVYDATKTVWKFERLPTANTANIEYGETIYIKNTIENQPAWLIQCGGYSIVHGLAGGLGVAWIKEKPAVDIGAWKITSASGFSGSVKKGDRIVLTSIYNSPSFTDNRLGAFERKTPGLCGVREAFCVPTGADDGNYLRNNTMDEFVTKRQMYKDSYKNITTLTINYPQ